MSISAVTLCITQSPAAVIILIKLFDTIKSVSWATNGCFLRMKRPFVAQETALDGDSGCG